MTDHSAIDAGQRSARRILVVDSALLIVLVVGVHLSFVATGAQEDFPLWAVAINWFAAGITLLAGLLARWVSDRTLRLLAATAVAAYAITLLTFPASVPAAGIDRIPWTLSASGAAAAAALVAGGRPLAWATVVAGAAAGLGYRALYGGLDLVGVVNDLQALLTGAVICVIGGHILAVGRGLDAEAASASAAAALESAERGRLSARTKAATLVHDEVLSTLALAASGLPLPRHRLAGQARAAVAAVTSLTDDQAHEPTVLRHLLADEARQHGVTFTVHDESTPAVGAFATTHDAILGATRQALHNSIRHAPDASRRVVLTHTDTETRVEITDDGPGFDPARIEDDRLGIRQSIIGRMSRLPGGSAEIEAAPGQGTRIRLRVEAAAAREMALSGGRASLRAGVAALTVIYLVTQTICAILATISVPRSWPLQVAMLATAVVASEILRATPGRRPSFGRTSVVVALAGGSMVAGVAASHYLYDLDFSYGTMWFAIGVAFIFVALALRARMRVALAGTVVLVTVLIGAGVLDGAPAGEILRASVRPVVLVGLAITLLVVVARMQRRILVLHRAAVTSAEKQSWSLAARSELTGRVAELARTALPLLQRIGAGGETTEAERSEYASCEGDLRDGLRAGSLARDPLRAVVASARERGVDVLLLDDHGDVADGELHPILEWMAMAVATAHTRVVGRLLPAGRPDRATLTVDGRHTAFAAQPAAGASSSPGPSSAGGTSVTSFHGE